MSETTNTPEDMAVLLTPKGRQDVREMFERHCNGPVLQTLKQVFCYYLDALEAAEGRAFSASTLSARLRAVMDTHDAYIGACSAEGEALRSGDETRIVWARRAVADSLKKKDAARRAVAGEVEVRE